MADELPGGGQTQSWLPDPAFWPERAYDLPELTKYPDSLNSTEELIDRNVEAGRGSHPAILSGDIVLTYGALRTAVNQFGNALRRLSVTEGDRVLLRSLNEPECLIANFAALKIGAIVVPTSPLLSAEQFRHLAADSAAVVTVVSYPLVGAVLSARPECPSLRHVIVTGVPTDATVPSGCLSYRELADGEPTDLAPVRRPRTAVAFLLYSSGITGPARATAHFMEEALIIPDVFGKYGWRVRPDDVIGTTGPISFAGGYSTALTIPYRFGATAAVIPLGSATTPAVMFDVVRRYGISLMAGMPTGFRKMLEVPDANPADLRSLRVVAGGGEPLAARTFREWKARFGHEIYEGFGTNGMTYVFISNVVHRKVKPDSMGTALPGYEVKALTASGAPAAAGEIGQLYARGPVGTIYWGPPSEAASLARLQRDTVRDGWVKIGDYVTIDDGGYVTFVSREEDLIISGEHRFGPDAVEKVLCADPAVADAGVIGCGPPGQQYATAYVIPHEDYSPGPDLALDILDRCRARLADEEVPGEIVFVRALPSTPYGTRLRRVQWAEWLAAQSQAGREQASHGQGGRTSG